MERKELRRMRKFELLELLLEQEREIQSLQTENAALKEQLDIQQIKIEQAGSIAEAALSLSGVFEAAQNAADLYLRLLKNHPEALNSVETDQRTEQRTEHGKRTGKSESGKHAKRGPTKRQRNRERTAAAAEETKP